MSTFKYNRDIEVLKKFASFFWPEDLSEKEAEVSIIPMLLATQDQFIAILAVDTDDLDRFFEVIKASSLSPNLFLKHLVVLSDFGGEMLQRVNSQFDFLFPNKTLKFVWNSKKDIYTFKKLPLKGILNNDKLGLSGKKLLEKVELSDLHKDIISLLLLGSACVVEHTAQILEKCEISNYLGNLEKLNKFIKERYIWVSRITSGSKSNSLGQIAQQYVYDYIVQNLKVSDYVIKSNGNIPGITHSDEESKLTTFDLVISKGKKYVALEISFQVTTNSVIERKAGQAKERFNQINSAKHKISYLIDGAGNFQRESAISTICNFSHCTIAFSQNELSILCNFLKEHLDG
jgi:hypothetical protein